MATYTKTTFVNGASPAINASELNKIGDGILEAINFAEGLDGRISALETSIGSSGNIGSTVASSLREVTWDDTNKKLTKTTNNGNVSDIFTASDLKSDLGMTIADTTGTVPVNRGGTGVTTITSGALLVGNGTGAIGTRGVINNTNVQAITVGTEIPTKNTIAYWDGSYNTNGASNLKYLATVTKGTWNASTIGVGYGGTGLTSSPSMLTNLGSTSAANVFAASPRPGVTGTLPVANGGTGATTVAAARNALGLGNTSGALPVANGGTGATTAANARTNLGITPSNIGAAASSHTHSFSDVTSGTLILRSTANYGTSLPSSATTGQIFFKY